MAATPTEPAHDVITTTIDLSAEVRKILGPHWNEPEISYEFGERKFKLRTGDAAIYATSPDF